MDSKIKVLYAKSVLSYDGATKITYDLIKSIKSKDEDISFDWFLYQKDNNTYLTKFRGLCDHFYVDDKKSKNKVINTLIRSLRFKKLLKKNQYDVVHIHTDNPGRIDLVLAAKLAGVPNIIVHSHNSNREANSFLEKYPVIHKINRKLINKTVTERFACSDAAAEWMFGKKNLDKVHMLNNGIDVDSYLFSESNRKEIRDRLKINKNTVVLGHVGRFAEVKNHKFLVSIIEGLKKSGSRYKLLLIGDGPLYAEIQNQVKDKGLLDNVIFVSNTDEINKYYSAMDMFLLPSLHEGLPLTGVEAQASGLMCLFSDTISTELGITKNVEFLPINDAQTWCSRIENFKINNKNRSEEKQEIKASLVKSGYDIDASAEELVGYYKNNKKR